MDKTIKQKGNDFYVEDARNWTEDFHLENGNYSNTCYQCGHEFIGYKRRIYCKSCDTELKKSKQ